MSEFKKFLKYETGDAILPSGIPEVIEFGADLFVSEDIVDKAYEVYLSMMAEEFRGGPGDVIAPADFAVAYSDGLYLCGVRRAIITHQYDAVNDVVPSTFSVWVGDGCVEVFREVSKVPREWRTAAQGRHFKHTLMTFNTGKPAGLRPLFITLMSDGRIIPAVPTSHGQKAGVGEIRSSLTSVMASVAINLYCDRRYLWQVETAEPLIGATRTPLSIGVSPEHIKSLFYARSLPVTESGRKRPILHWVRAHLRRLADGIDVDISKHLRGISEFEMGGFDWAITNPVKEISK